MNIATFKSPDWDETMKELNKVEWKCTSFQCTYKFENPDKGGEWIKNFMKYIKSCEKYSMKATKRHFLKLILNKGYGRGHMNTFFAAVKDAGIVHLHQVWNGKFTESTYTRGDNWNAYLEGRLRRV